MDEEEENSEQDAWEQFFVEVELAVLSILASRLATIDAGMTYTSLLATVPQDMAAIYAAVDQAAKSAAERAGKSARALLDTVDEWSRQFYAGTSRAFRSLLDLIGGKDAADKGGREAVDQIERTVKTSVMRMLGADGKPAGLREAYVSQCNYALSQIKAGRNPDKVVTETVKRLANAGVRVEYEGGATRELYSAASMNIMDAWRAERQEAMNVQADSFGADGVEVSSHALCAPDHLPYQGRRFTTSQFNAIQSSLSRKIGEGKNCRHYVKRVVLSVGGTSSKQRAKNNRKSLRKVENPSGGTMTAYEFSQWQRQRETAIRKKRMQAELLDAAKQAGEAEKARRDISAMKNDYDRWSKRNGVPTRHQRMML